MSKNTKSDIHNTDPSLPETVMKTFIECFSLEVIIEEICAQRIKLKAKRHAGKLFDRIFQGHQGGEHRDHDSDADLDGLLPPRKVWSRYRQPNKNRREMKSKDIDLAALQKAVRRLIKEDPTLPWVSRLLERASWIRYRALHADNPSFHHACIIGRRKDQGSSAYRPITIYGLDDNIIQKLTARYLSQTLDFCFSDACCAYRSSQGRADSPINRESALGRLAKFRADQQTVYVAEADLRNFMDCVDHSIARHALRQLIIQAKGINPAIEVDPRAIQLYDAALDSYSFQRDVLGHATEILQRRDRHGRFIWPMKELSEMHDRTQLGAIGIPQGGALSCFVVNVMLHEVDQAVESTPVPFGHKLQYLRFCDDMLILSTSRDVCHNAMGAYMEAIKAKLLLAHEPVDINHSTGKSDESNYLDVKSKMPYLWARKENGGIPQVQFLGFLIRYDGQFLIRAKSIHKQVRKICDEAKMLSRRIRSADGALKMPPHEILRRFHMKLVAMSVGRRKPGQPPPKCRKDIKPMCWADGYKLLWETYYDPTQLKQLDYHREQAMQRIFDQLKPFMYTDKSRADADRVMSKIREQGYRNSYYGQFGKLHS